MIDRNNIIEAAEQAFANVIKPKQSACMKVGFLRGAYWFKCALCPQVFNCPYDKKDGRVVFTKECTGK